MKGKCMKRKTDGFIKRNFCAAVAGIFITGSSAFGSLIISEVDLVGNRVELVNIGTNTVNASGWWWCNRVNGSPFYDQVATASTIDLGLSTATNLVVGAGEILVLDLSAGFLPNVNGELGLYNSNSFGSTSALEDYVAWGGNGIRDVVADSKGIWDDNTFVNVSSITTQTFQVSFGNVGNANTEYIVAESTLGTAQSIPEPSTIVFMGVAGLGGFFMRRRLRR